MHTGRFAGGIIVTLNSDIAIDPVNGDPSKPSAELEPTL
jgi:hypothetical protein